MARKGQYSTTKHYRGHAFRFVWELGWTYCEVWLDDRETDVIDFHDVTDRPGMMAEVAEYWADKDNLRAYIEAYN